MSALQFSAPPATTATLLRNPVDVDAVRSLNPLSTIAGAMVKLRKVGREWKGLCPFHAERTPSFTIYAGDERAKCFGCGWQGDVIDFVQKAYGYTFPEAVDRLGGDMLPKATYSPAILDRAPKDDRTPEALAIWEAAQAATGTPAEAYLRLRAITMPLPPTIRFTRLHYCKSGPQYPVLVALIQNVAGEPIGIQRTYLDPVGIGKAAVAKPKLSLGGIRGGAIRIGDAVDTVAICEGLEDGLTLTQALGQPTWATAGTSNLAALELPETVRNLVIGADNDAPGRKAAQECGEAFAAKGYSVRIIRPALGNKDFNAEAMSVAARTGE
jgi:DNA primase